MKRVIIFIIFFVLIVGGGILLLYFLYEKPAQENNIIETTSFNIFALDKEKMIVTNYKIEGSVYSEGQTSDVGGIVEKIPFNSSVRIYNVNLPNQHYYTTQINRDVTSNNPQRIELRLEKAGELDIHYYNFNSSVIVLINSTGLYKNLHYCIKWSVHFITIKSDYIEMLKPKEMSSWDKCYNTQITLMNNSMNLTLPYNYFGVLGKEDYINLLIYDEDCINGFCFNSNNNTDIGGKNYLVNINNI